LVALSDISLDISAWLRKRQFRKYLPILLQLLEPQKQDIILDVGAGTGVIAEEMVTLCDEVFALEPDPKKVNYMKKRYPQVKSFDGSAEAIQFPEFYFTKAYAIASVHHFSNKDNALYELNRILKKGGLLVVKDMEPGTGRSRFEIHATKGVQFISSADLKEKLEETGFDIKEVRKFKNGEYFIAGTRVH
jgi:ubiquinone/menaquinone biosynthesis C-methylase UbiE